MDGIVKRKRLVIVKKTVAEKIAADIQTLPELESGKVSIGLMIKFGALILLMSLISIILPQKTYAFDEVEITPNPLVFEAGDHTQFLEEIESEIAFEFKHETAVAKLRRQMRMTDALKSYLQSKGSPLAEYTSTILKQNNWKKIIALSNAESSLCRRYIEEKANCWGVGGNDLWDMGANLGEGVIAMNNFLNGAPKKSSIKYSQMNFEQMNGLYKQPPGDHWVLNNLKVWNDLTAIEKSLK